jgi:hypothetical protein
VPPAAIVAVVSVLPVTRQMLSTAVKLAVDGAAALMDAATAKAAAVPATRATRESDS